MKFSYTFHNLLGSVYRKGNVLFTQDGNSLLSPVGNRLTIFDLKNNKSETLPVESRFNYTCLALSPRGNALIAVNEDGEASFISLISRTVLNKYRFNRTVRDIKFSPDGRYYAVTTENKVALFSAPGLQTREFNPFVTRRVFAGAYDDVVCLDWTSDSRVLAVGSKDMNTRIYAVNKFSNLFVYTLGGHSDSIVGCFFEKDSLDMYTVSGNGQICVWECSIDLNDLIPWKRSENYIRQDAIESDSDEEKGEEAVVETVVPTEVKSDASKLFYKRRSKHILRGDDSSARITAVNFHRGNRIMVSGFSNGAFFLHEMPDFNLIHSLSIAEQHITTVALNCTGDWIGIGCEGFGQLIVWEWQSESFIMKQQGHFNSMNCLAYSPDGCHLATGGDDCKVKLWNVTTGFCIVTFTQHESSITGIAFAESGKVIVSSSLDGTVRVFDINRYRNFKTLTANRPTQFSCLALDGSTEFVAAGCQDSFEIYVWAMKTGHLMEILSGHEGPVSSLTFNANQVLASGSWDKTVRFWDVFVGKENRETINMSSDVLAVCFRPDGQEVAVASLDANITFFHVPSFIQTHCIEGRNDLGSGRKDTDLVKAKTVLKGKAFTTICYSADGSHVLAGGQSKNVCIYHVAEQLLVKKFEISQNRSFDGMDDYVNRRKMTEFGNVALVEQRHNDDAPVAISLPGVRQGDMASRAFKPEVRVNGVVFSPTGRCWAASTTEGILVYSLDNHHVFSPFDLDVDITPEGVRNSLAKKEYSSALLQAFRLNETNVITEVIENVSVGDIGIVSQSLPLNFVERLLGFLGIQLESTRHLEFYLLWIQSILMIHGQQLKTSSMALMATLHLLQKNLTVRHNDLRSVCEKTKYSLAYIMSLGELNMEKRAEVVDNDDVMEED